jgi:hypothetical protein
MKEQRHTMSPEELHRTQTALEGERFNEEGYLVRWKDMPGESGPPARLRVVDYGYDQAVYFAEHIDRKIEALIRSFPIKALLRGERRVFDLLGRQKKVEGHAEYWTYTASEGVPLPASPMVQKLSSRDPVLRGFADGFFGIDYESVFVVSRDGAVVSAATSSREDEASAEAWVYTSPEHRRQGLAAQVASAWLQNVVDSGRTPFYSHAKDNVASRRLAERLQLRLCFVLSCYP